MIKARTRVLLFALLCLAFVVYVSSSSSLLPERVASHFDARGQPDGWMDKGVYLPFMGGMGLVLPLFVIGLTYLSRFFPDWMVNLPHKAYWLSPEQRPRTNAYILRHCFWLGCMIVCLMGSGHYMTVQANRSSPVQLAAGTFSVIMAGFLVGIAIWVITLIRHFRTPA